MPRGRKKKELPPLENGLNNNNIVQKSKPLFCLWKSDLTLSEFKILDTYLSRINSHISEQRSVVFEKGELEKYLGVSKINLKDLDLRLKHLQETSINFSNEKNKINRITLFERSFAEQDENGLWQVQLTCTPSAMKYIFNIEKLGYLRYQIRSVTQLSSLYSYILFTYLEYNRFRKSWEVSLTELKSILNCSAERYNQYKFFNSDILKKCQAELITKTECKFNYEPIKKGRSVVAIKFTLKTISDTLKSDDDKQPIIFNQEKESQYSTENLGFLAAACNYEFSDSQMKIINGYVNKNISSLKDTDRYDYLYQKYNELNYRDERNKDQGKPIKDRFAYFQTMFK